MKNAFTLALILLSINAMGKSPSASQNSDQNSVASKDLKLGTSFRFSPLSLKGKFQNSPSTEAVVESDKFLDDLLGPRKSFADRIQQNQQRN
jgi:hypothetical protein